MEIIDKIKDILVKPVLFFERIEKESGVKKAFIYFAILALFSTIFAYLVNLVMPTFTIGFIEKMIGVDIPESALMAPTILSTILFFILSLAMSFVSAGILHMWIMIFGGKLEYSKSYQLFSYSRTPAFLFGWIPFIGIFAKIYSLVLLVLGTEKMCGFPRKKAILMYLIPLVILYLLVFVGFFVLIMGLRTIPLDTVVGQLQ